MGGVGGSVMVVQSIRVMCVCGEGLYEGDVWG